MQILRINTPSYRRVDTNNMSRLDFDSSLNSNQPMKKENINFTGEKVSLAVNENLLLKVEKIKKIAAMLLEKASGTLAAMQGGKIPEYVETPEKGKFNVLNKNKKILYNFTVDDDNKINSINISNPSLDFKFIEFKFDKNGQLISYRKDKPDFDLWYKFSDNKLHVIETDYRHDSSGASTLTTITSSNNPGLLHNEIELQNYLRKLLNLNFQSGMSQQEFPQLVISYLQQCAKLINR